MCGIAGLLEFGGAAVCLDDIESLTGALAHRGRDSAGWVVGGDPGNDFSAYPGIALGHRRLSIIDLSPQSAQPMRSLSGAATIVYNGELYNYAELRRELVAAGYRFRTESDSEVMLVAYEAWGEACLDRFNGMFAFAVWDETRQSLFCARDPLGIKPFYFSCSASGFAFASESQALARVLGSGLDRRSVACYFLSMYVPRQLSIFAGVTKLLPGHWMRISRDGETKIQAYWQRPEAGARRADPDEAARELTELLDRAVAAQLRSDVPVGALLSGGFDSGMILASAARTGMRLHTYSVGFDDGAQESELPVARDMAARYGATHHERVIRGDEILGFLDAAVAGLSEPVADSAIVPTYCLSGMAAADGVKVLLSGTGGDEVFAGYSRYVASSLQRRALFAMSRGLRRVIGRSALAPTVLGARLRHPSLDMMVYTGGSPALASTFFAGNAPFAAFLDELAGDVFPPPGNGTIGLYEHMSFDLQVYLPDLLLLLLDQLTMVHTVEGRVPLLDVDLIKASYALAAGLHADPRRSQTRALMRRMAAGRLDQRTFSARKLGFSGPVQSWLGANRDAFRDPIMAARELPVLRDMPIERLWTEGERQPNRQWAMAMFSIYCFSRWYNTHGIARG